MSLDDLYFSIQVKKTIEFTYNSISYRLFVDKDSQGNDIIKFGPLYEEKIFDSYGQLINEAKVENHSFKYLIQDIEI